MGFRPDPDGQGNGRPDPGILRLVPDRANVVCSCALSLSTLQAANPAAWHPVARAVPPRCSPVAGQVPGRQDRADRSPVADSGREFRVLVHPIRPT
jgi:hypothetical protein